MGLKIVLHSALIELIGHEMNPLTAVKPKSLNDLLYQLGLDNGAVGLVIFNGKVLDRFDTLPDEGTIFIYPVIGGG